MSFPTPTQRQPRSTLFPYTTLFRSRSAEVLCRRFAHSPPGAAGRHCRLGTRRCCQDRGLRCRRSEEHTSELQSRGHLVCRLLLEKKKKRDKRTHTPRTPPTPKDLLF